MNLSPNQQANELGILLQFKRSKARDVQGTGC